jgi:hypothetical protein
LDIIPWNMAVVRREQRHSRSRNHIDHQDHQEEFPLMFRGA